MAESKLTIIPRDEKAIAKIREYGWKQTLHSNRWGGKRPRSMSIPEDNYDATTREAG